MDLGPLERSLAQTTLAPYIVKAMAMIDLPRKAGSNMFRHQMSTLAILLDYKVVDPVLLKASVIHDLFEELGDESWVTRDSIAAIDAGVKIWSMRCWRTSSGVKPRMRSTDGLT